MNKEEILTIIKSNLIDKSKIKNLLSDLNIIGIAEILHELNKEKQLIGIITVDDIIFFICKINFRSLSLYIAVFGIFLN